MALAETETRKPIPFNVEHLDRLLDEAGIDVLVATSKHNIQYLLGGYRFFFFDSMDAVGVTRYLPALVYRKGKPEQAAYIGCGMESYEQELGKFWPANLDLSVLGSKETMQQALDHIKKLTGVRRVGVESGFMPADGEAVLRQGLSNCDIVDAVFPLERLRACKTPEEIGYLREASERVVASMLATFAQCKPGMTKQEVNETLRREEVNRGLVFDYCLLTAGTSLNRAPSEQRLAPGDIMSLDSGGNYKGYIGDLCRMGILGTAPDAELVDLLGFIEEVQQAARKPVRRGGRGGDVIDVAEAMLDGSPHRKYTHYMAHGMGLVTHEAPRLMNNPRMSYTGYDMDRPLESGMVISIETTMSHPKRGFIKLEDTVLVTDDGYEALGDGGRGWNRAG
ncbi:Xaa-Pro peptidase family protein [Bradyrhizobium sp. LHD-71]|uniref:Xaa-Pro peptidase family protein n=1 Tax=Bradyrhizobium sp. LHD-71 TaxID=3072141 RepID=UPI00280D369E|nr:Xaa-Pro peptidase family protein [Bradyrhizobium sp. LHD-71]MDQ8729785.1 Xaa-Pro peptidase family protein [Bradyrhizobium sp. LHD-71]